MSRSRMQTSLSVGRRNYIWAILMIKYPTQTKYYAYEGNQERRTQNRSQIASFVVPDGVNMVERSVHTA